MTELWGATSVTPLAYAARLATYISDPSTIRVRTLENFSRAPSVEQCFNLRQAHLAREQRQASKVCDRYRYFNCTHPQTEENTILTIDGWDKCRTCIEDEQAKRRAKELEEQDRDRAARERRIKLAKQRQAERLASLEDERLSGSVRPRISSDAMAAVADLFEITVSDLKGSSRNKHLVAARSVVCMILRDGGLSYPQIARLMNRECHSSIVNLCKTFTERAALNPFIWEAYKAVRRA